MSAIALCAFIHAVWVRSASSVAEDGAPPASAQQVEFRAYFGEWIARRLDAGDARNGVEDDLPLLRFLVVHAARQSNRAKGKLGAALRPWHAGVGDVIARAGKLHEDAETGRTSCQARADLVEEEVSGLRGGLVVR